jgi:aminomethyltransferase
MAAESEGLVKTPLFDVHEQYGARIVEFAGWAMPIEYEGTLVEHTAVRDDLGVFDVSHLGTLIVSGDDAEATVAASFTNDPSRLGDGEAQYTLCCDDRGGVVDDLIVYRIAGDRYVTVPNAANTAAVRAALVASAAEREAEVDDVSRHYAIIAVQGPRALEVAAELFPASRGIGYMEVIELDLGPSDTGWLARTGYTGEVGVELIVPALDGPGLFRRLVDDHDATPAGLGARDTLRLEMGYPLHGQDLTTDTDPYEARLPWAVVLDRDDFRGARRLRERADGDPARLLWGVRAVDRGIPRPGMAVSRDGEPVGTVTSGTFSPTLRTGIGLAYLDRGIGPSDEVDVDVRGTEHRFEVVRPPFVDADPRG